MPGTGEATRLRDVSVTVGEFSGPLDLLLQLVQARQLPITRLSLRAVTEQFLLVLNALEEDTQPELLADFLVVASRLTALKARALVPRPPVEDAPEEPLVQDLRRYRFVREAAEWLRAREAAGLRSWGRPPQPRPRAQIGREDPQRLLQAIQRWARRQRPLPRVLAWKPTISLAAMVERLRERLVGRQSFR
ncbi:MAG: segregation/condensation protein A, partial [Thermomicrobium sp.]|nr:segregation/condensation protein A [Thermomicrobium sp.]